MGATVTAMTHSPEDLCKHCYLGLLHFDGVWFKCDECGWRDLPATPDEELPGMWESADFLGGRES